MCLVAMMVAASAAEVNAAGLEAPRNINVEPSSPASAALASRSATEEMKGRPQDALNLANQAIQADPRNPWPYYDKGMALARLGQTDAAVEWLLAAEPRFAPADRWGKSVAIYGRAHALAAVGRCAEAKQAYEQYASFVESADRASAELARKYAGDCRSPAAPVNQPPAMNPLPPPSPPAP